MRTSRCKIQGEAKRSPLRRRRPAARGICTLEMGDCKMQNEPAVEIETFDYRSAGEAEFAALNNCQNRLRAESWPDDPPIELDERITHWRSIPAFVDVRLWTAWKRPAGSDAAIVATGHVTTADMPSNRHAAEFNIGVLPEFRRRGLGTQLLARVAEAAAEADRRLLITFTDSRIPAGDAFMERAGARVGVSARESELDLEQLDASLMNSWIERAPRDEFELGLWEGPYPEEALPVVVAMIKAINLAPRGDLEIEDEVWTPELLRQRDGALVERGVERWTL